MLYRVLFFIFCALFVFFRLYKIDETFFFFNDMGRDYVVLQEWAEKGRPPLLGPQNSALPFNQSSWYFYLIYPAYLLSPDQPVVVVYWVVFMYLICFGWAFFMARGNSALQRAVLFSMAILSIHPTVITQNIFVWNPSLLPPVLLLTFVSLNKNLPLAVGSLVLALGLSYSVAVTFVVLSVYLFLKYKFKIIKYYFLFTGVIFGPLLIFEVKYNFLLTKAVLFGTRLTQERTDLVNKLISFREYLLVGPVWFYGFLLFGLLVIFRKNKQDALIILASILLTLVLPFSPHAHYIFGILVTILFIFGKNLAVKHLVLIFTVCGYFFVPKISFSKAPRSLAELQACFEKVCKDRDEPVFVSVVSSYHPFHNGPEHRYLLKRAGCKVVEIEKDPSLAKAMLVVEDGGKYTHGKSDYYELSLFGKSKEKQRYSCQGNLGVVELVKN